MKVRFTIEDYNRILLGLNERTLHYSTVFHSIPETQKCDAFRKELTAYEDLMRKVSLRRRKLLERLEAQK